MPLTVWSVLQLFEIGGLVSTLGGLNVSLYEECHKIGGIICRMLRFCLLSLHG